MRNAVIGLVAIAFVGCNRNEGTGELTPVTPHIVTQPQSATVIECTGATFEILVSGTPPLTFRWFADEVEIPGAAERRLVLPRVGLASDGTRLRVIVSNALGEATSDEALLTVTAADGPRVLVDDHVCGLVAGGDEVFWTNCLGVYAAPVDCDQPIRTIYSRASPGETTYALAMSQETVVWTDYVAGTVKAARADGTSVRTVAAGLPVMLTAVVSDAERAYWTNGSGWSGLQTAPLGGDGPVTTLAPGPIDSWVLALDDEYVYVLEWPESLLRIGRADGAVTVLAGGLSSPTGLALAGAYAYWTETLGRDTDQPVGLVRRVSRDGGEPQLVASHAGMALALATDGTHVYWTIQTSDRDSSGAVARVLLDGSGSVEYVVSDLDRPFQLTLAGSLVVWADARGIRTLSKPPAP